MFIRPYTLRGIRCTYHSFSPHYSAQLHGFKIRRGFREKERPLPRETNLQETDKQRRVERRPCGTQKSVPLPHMKINSLQITNFRAIIHAELTFGQDITIFSGANGSGKTNIVDAIHYLCMSRSFVHASDMYAITKSASSFEMTGEFSGKIRSDFAIGCSYARGSGKSFTINKSPLAKLADIIGLVPVITLAPDDRKLTMEGPAERRGFLDAMISQLSKAYLLDLMEFRKIMKQRNALLSEHGWRGTDISMMLEAWDHQLVEVGARIISARKSHLSKFSQHLDYCYKQLSGLPLKPRFEYKTCVSFSGEKTIKEQYGKLLEETTPADMERGNTQHGPHRDDLVFYLDDFELRKFGSQGQHRIFAMALKLAQLSFYSEELDEMPILILDDVFGDLDAEKTKIVLNMLAEHPGQAFITVANPDLVIPNIDPEKTHFQHLHFSDGKLYHNEEPLNLTTHSPS